jgi:hypothetical protein
VDECCSTENNRGGLTLPSDEFEKIVKISETLFSRLLIQEGGNPFKIKNICSSGYLVKNLHTHPRVVPHPTDRAG